MRDLERTGVPKHFDTTRGAERSYERLLPAAIGCEAWLICWPPGSCAPLHDHGEARGLGYVVRGSLSEWRSAGTAARGRDRIWLPHRAVELPLGVCHEVKNLESEVAYSVHLYDPSLEQMTFYDRSTTGVLRPIRREEAPQWNAA